MFPRAESNALLSCADLACPEVTGLRMRPAPWSTRVPEAKPRAGGPHRA